MYECAHVEACVHMREVLHTHMSVYACVTACVRECVPVLQCEWVCVYVPSSVTKARDIHHHCPSLKGKSY